MLKTMLVAALLATAAATSALAQGAQRGGTVDEQKACAPDVSRYCRAVMNESDLTILGCLQAHRAKISKKCDKVLLSHGQ
jgi:hypothetical protein